MSDAIVCLIEIAFWDDGEAKRAYAAIEKLLHDMGQIGQMAMISPQSTELRAWAKYRGDSVMEEWRDIPGWPYRVSNLGRVCNARNNKVKKLKRRRGYLFLTLHNKGKQTSQSVHRLVCEAFHGSAPDGKSLVRHLDGDVSNNNPANLAWGSHLDNEADSRRLDTRPRGERHYSAKLTDGQIAEIRQRHKAAKKPNGCVPHGFNVKLAAEFGIHVGTLDGIVAANPTLETDRPLRRYYSEDALRRRRNLASNRPDNLTDDELAEYVIQSKGILIP